MIFVTTGTQFPFDRLLKPIEKWSKANKTWRVVAQTCESNLNFTSIEAFDLLTPIEYSEYFSKATVVIAHAGVGTIISAYEFNKPVILMARLADLNEHRNDHQLSTIAKFRGVEGIYIAKDESELICLLEDIDSLVPPNSKLIENRVNLINYLKIEVNS